MAKITKEKIKGCVKGSALTIATLCGVIGGIVLGISLKEMKGKIFHENISFKLPYSFIFLLPLIGRYQIYLITMNLIIHCRYNKYCIKIRY